MSIKNSLAVRDRFEKKPQPKLEELIPMVDGLFEKTFYTYDSYESMKVIGVKVDKVLTMKNRSCVTYPAVYLREVGAKSDKVYKWHFLNFCTGHFDEEVDVLKSLKIDLVHDMEDVLKNLKELVQKNKSLDERIKNAEENE